MKNDQQKLRPETAEKLFPDYEEYPSIDETGSLEGMEKLYNWKPENCFLIDGYIYHLSGHPQLRESINRKFLTTEELSTVRRIRETYRGHREDQLKGEWGPEEKAETEQELELLKKIENNT
jgi:hypothetical protein